MNAHGRDGGPLRVGINARLLASPDLRGFNRYTAELVRALAASGRVEPVLFSDFPVHPVHGLERLRCVAQPVRPQARWQHRWLPLALRHEQIDVFHAPAHWGVPWRAPCPVVATIHDLADRERPDLRARAGLKADSRHAFEQWLVVRRAFRIIAVSEWTARSIAGHLRVDPARLAVTVEGAASEFDEPHDAAAIAAARTEFGLREPYFLYVGGFDARKNLGVIVRALALLPAEQRVAVALVGEGGNAAQLLRRDAVQAGVDAWIVLAGGVGDRKLAALYAGALAVVIPSWLEGFGLPVVEAMHVGTPAIVSSGGSLPEIAGEAGLVFSPEDPAALAAAMHRVAADAALRGDLAARARARAPLYTWARAAEQTADVYEMATARPRA